MKVRPSFIIILILSGLLYLLVSKMPLEKRLYLMESLGIPKPTRPLPGVLEDPLQQGRAQVEAMMNGIESHSTACYSPTTRDTSDVEAQAQVFTWVDEEGKVHFGDKPRHASAQDLSDRYAMEKQYFRIAITPVGGNLPPFLHDRLSADLRQLYFVLSRWLPDQYIKQVELNVKVFNDQGAFDHYRETHVPGLTTSSGFYKASLDEAVVMAQSNDASTQAIGRHEATHVINAGLYGRTPTWFNEGLAEYFERLSIEGQSKTVTVPSHHVDLLNDALANDGLMMPGEYFAIEGRAWREHDQQLMYAMAWSMVHFMMQDSLGRETMKSLMTHMAVNYCQPVDTLAFIEQHYVGGLKAFTKRWRAVILSGSFQHHRY